MRFAGIRCGVTAVVAGAVAGLGAAGQDQRPVFRASSELVAVPVSVMDGNAPVTGLTAADFELRDNGVLQITEFVGQEDAPIDLTVVADSSGWAIGAGSPFEQFQRDVERLSEVLRPGDRIRVLAFDFAVRALLPWTPAGHIPASPWTAVPGRSTQNDAITASLIAARMAGRRQVVAALVVGIDNLSGVDTSRVVDLAGRTNVALYPYQLDPSDSDGREVRPRLTGVGASRRRTLRPGGLMSSLEPRPVRMTRMAAERMLALERAAERTGGRPRDSQHSALGSLHNLMEEFRRSYVLYFRPSGPADAAWHDLRVDLRRPPARRYAVWTRPGYMRIPEEASQPASGAPAPRPEASTGPAPAAAAPVFRTTVTSDMVPSLLERYRGEYAAVVDELRGAANRDETAGILMSEGRRWIERGTAASSSRRRAVVASLALEVGGLMYPLPAWEMSRESHLAWTRTRRRLTVWGAELLRENLRATDIERAWYLAAIASLQGREQFRHDMGYRKEAAVSEKKKEPGRARPPGRASEKTALCSLMRPILDPRSSASSFG
jgi:hypothetical protein